MKDATLIADLVRAGLDPDLVCRVANALVDVARPVEQAPIPSEQEWNKAEQKRARDRDRKRRALSIPPEQYRIPPEQGYSAPIPPEQLSAPLIKESTKKDSKRRGSRIPPDWSPSQADIEFALAKGMSRQRADTEAEKFRNYWTAKTGKEAAKLDWSATWRNWVLSSLERVPGDVAPASTGPPDWKRPPWEREGLSEAAWRSRELEKIRPTIRGNPGSSKNGAGHADELQLSGGMAHHDEAKAAGRASDHIPWDD